jgi:hypothetical protein
MRRAAATALPLFLALSVTACGGGGGNDPQPTTAAKPATMPDPTVRGSHPAKASDRKIVKAWTDSLRRGDIQAADALWALPALVQNGLPRPTVLRNQAAVHFFDISLPCGAVLIRTAAFHGYTLAEFRLTQRAGEGGGECGGSGSKAATAFKIKDGRIREWRRIQAFPGTSPTAPKAGGSAV